MAAPTLAIRLENATPLTAAPRSFFAKTTTATSTLANPVFAYSETSAGQFVFAGDNGIASGVQIYLVSGSTKPLYLALQFRFTRGSDDAVVNAKWSESELKANGALYDELNGTAKNDITVNTGSLGVSGKVQTAFPGPRAIFSIFS